MPLELIKTGDGLTLRPFCEDDAADLAAVEFDVEVKRYLTLPATNKADWISSFEPAEYGGWRAWAVEVDGVLAGRASLLRRRLSRLGDLELAIVIARPYWAAGLGQKAAAMLIQTAFEEYGAKAILADVHPENRASIALVRAFKFRRRGLVPLGHWQHGHFAYRLSRGAYNKSAQGRQPTPAPGLQR